MVSYVVVACRGCVQYGRSMRCVLHYVLIAHVENNSFFESQRSDPGVCWLGGRKAQVPAWLE